MYTSTLKTNNKDYRYLGISEYAQDQGIDINRLPISLKVILENILRHSDREYITPDAPAAVAAWKAVDKGGRKEIFFHPARVIMQDFTGGPALADLAAMREALNRAGGDGSKINPMIPVDMVIDHSVMADYTGTAKSFIKNVEMEFNRNGERYRFFKWGQQAFDNFRVVPPGTGIVHQVNLEYLASVVAQTPAADGGSALVFPDTLVGTDSHTTMINGLSVLGWGVGGIEAEAAMLGQPLTMVIPDVIGFRFKGKLKRGTTATDLVLKVVQMLREYGVVGSFVEFFGPGLQHLSLADRATISNMSPEYGATCGFFPVDNELLDYLRLTGRNSEHIDLVEVYAKTQGLWRNDDQPASYTDVIELDLAVIEPAVAGPRRPQDLIPLGDVPASFGKALTGIYKTADSGKENRLNHGDVVIAAITSCTNTSNPEILVTAGLIAEKAVKKGLSVKPWVKTSFAPGSKVVTAYLENSGLMDSLDKLGFNLTAYGCTTCIGNSGPLFDSVKNAVIDGDLVAVNILSGNRNFEGRINPLSKASYLASPPLVVLYALAGTVKVNLVTDPIGKDLEGKDVFIGDLWPEDEDVKNVINKYLRPELFTQRYADVFNGPEQWRNLTVPEGDLYAWEENSTYIRKPPFFDSFGEELYKDRLTDIEGARCLAIFPDSTTTDHISPAGDIPVDSPAGRYLLSRGISAENFNSYGSRRANHEVMVRGTFANIRIKNRMNPEIEGGYTRDSAGNTAAVFDAACSWNDTALIVFAGKEYGTGSSRDWAAKGPMLQGVKAVVAGSYERIHRSNLLGMGILPLEFKKGDSVDSLEIIGDEIFSVRGLNKMQPSGELLIEMKRRNGNRRTFSVNLRIDTGLELKYWKSGGILNYVLDGFLNQRLL